MPRSHNERGWGTTDTDTTDTEDSYASDVEETPESDFTREKSIVDANVILTMSQQNVSKHASTYLHNFMEFSWF